MTYAPYKSNMAKHIVLFSLTITSCAKIANLLTFQISSHHRRTFVALFSRSQASAEKKLTNNEKHAKSSDEMAKTVKIENRLTFAKKSTSKQQLLNHKHFGAIFNRGFTSNKNLWVE